VPFQRDTVGRLALVEWQARALEGVLGVLDPVGCACKQRKLLAFPGYVYVLLQPENTQAATIQIFLYDDGEVGVAAGAGVYFNLPSDLPDPVGVDVATCLAEVVTEIVSGKLSETIYRRRGVVYRWDFSLTLGDREFRLHRTDICRLFTCFWGPRIAVAIRYSPYQGREPNRTPQAQ
jgi:hypothetical protein